MKKIALFLLIIVCMTASPVRAQQGVVISSDQTTAARVGCFKFIQNLGFADGPRNNKETAVLELQQALYSSGYLKVTPTGYFGLLTLGATMAYQRDNGINQTGFVGPVTRGILRSQYCGNPPIAMCDYPAPPENCTYVPGPTYNNQTQCGMVLSCGQGNNQGVPNNCKVWYDGCNTCSRNTPGGPMMCTMMACMTDHQETYCKDYFQLIQSCPEQKVVDYMPIVCIQAPCNPIDRSYYIYNGQRREMSEFDNNWVRDNCRVHETIVY